MRCAIHQPQFLPWLGYLHKIGYVDKFVFLDDVQFKKNEFQNRNKILVADSAHWLTVPVSFRFGDTLMETLIADDTRWRQKIIRTLEMNYSKAPFFEKFIKNIVDILNSDWDSLSSLNRATVEWLIDCFGLKTEILASSEMRELSEEPTQRLVDICRKLGADTYISGAGGRNYLDVAMFEDAGVTLEYQNFTHPIYPQTNGQGEFVPYLSAIDGLFNCGGGEKGRQALGLDMSADTVTDF